MGTWTEQYYDRGLQDSAQGEGRSRGWNVSGSTVDAAKAEPEAPSVLDEHPDYPDLKVASVIYTPTGFGCKVRANYLPPEYISSGPISITGDDYIKIDTTFVDADIRIPVFENVTKKSMGPSGNVIVKSVWRTLEGTAIYRYALAVHRITINSTVVSQSNVEQQLSLTVPVSNQINKVHTIGGNQYLFKSDGIRRLKKDQYQFTYRWTYDPGVPNTLGPEYNQIEVPNLALLGSLAFPFYDEDYIVPPYHRMSAAANSTNPSVNPVVVATPKYLYDPTGHLTLPGVS